LEMRTLFASLTDPSGSFSIAARTLSVALGMNQSAGDSLDRGLDAGCGAQFGPGIVEVKVYGPLGQVQYDSDFGGCFPARSPGQHLDLASLMSTNFDHTSLRATPASRALIMVSRTSKSTGLVTKSSAPSCRALSSTSRSVTPVKKMKGIFRQRGAAASRSNTSKPDEVGMLISHNTRSGTDCTIAE